MKSILVIGAGLSSSSLIRYLLLHAESNNWQVRVVDQNLDLAKSKIAGNPNGIALNFDALNPEVRRPEIEKSDLVISMLPAKFHIDIAKDCIELKTNLITPSYISPEMKGLHQQAKEAGILIMNEIGVDPGIDHMSAMKIIHSIQAKGGEVISFKSFCGGLIAPESDNNPWNYKFTWNPRNVVLAGQGSAACFIRNGQYKYIPYNRLYSRLDKLSIENYGEFDGYPNRDSLSYRAIYGLEKIPTIFRGTLRRPGYCQSWNVFIELGMTDDSYTMIDSKGMTARSFINAFLPYHPTATVEDKFKAFLGENRISYYPKFEWLGLFENDVLIAERDATPAQLLQELLVRKLSLSEGDKDMLVMIHEFEYILNNQKHKITSSMVNIGEDQTYTSMSNTVGLPVAICAKLILTNQIRKNGVTLPIEREIYEPILAELKDFNIDFVEVEEQID